MKSSMKLVLLIVMMVVPVALAGVKPLKNPEPVSISSGLTQAQVAEAIKKGCRVETGECRSKKRARFWH